MPITIILDWDHRGILCARESGAAGDARTDHPPRSTEAEEEMAEAYDWYERRLYGLGSEFLLNVDATMNAILRNPQQFSVMYRNLRRALTRRFPYQVLFVVEDNRIIVIAVFHVKRNPKCRQERT